ncbi:MAG: host attachment protein [Prosthecobacter sp.]|nr:host attachment protein [Prosthecobacter sp.]
MATPFIVVADRGRLRMFSVETVGPRHRLRSLADVQPIASHLKIGEKYTDQAGARDNSGDALNAKGTLEKPRIAIEENKRLLEWLGKNITTLLREHGAENWMFAAPPEVNNAILEYVDSALKTRLTKNISRDLVNSDIENVAKQFGISLQAPPGTPVR